MRLGPIFVVTLVAFAAAVQGYGLQLTDQCVSRIYDLTYPYQGLQPGWYRYYWLNFTEVGDVHLVIRADVSSNVPVKLAIYNAQGQEIWATQPSTRIMGTYTIDLEAPGAYRLGIENPRSNTASASFTAVLNVTMCGGPAPGPWLRQHIKLKTTNVVINGDKASMAPMGITSYGVMEVGGRYFTYVLTTDAVRGVVNIPSDISASSYREDGSPYGRAFTIQLNAFVVARLKDGTAQYYWIQNVVLLDKTMIWVGNNIWNSTARPSILDKSAVSGNGKVYAGPASHGDYYAYTMPSTIPFGRVELEIRVRTDGGKIIVEFYANGQKYDTVHITPHVPATSAHITIAPATTPTYHPLDLELILGGRDADIPYAVLHDGQIDLELYVSVSGKWIPPPSAWSVGSVTYERSYAYVEPQGVGSAIVKPGPPNPRQLWAGTVVVTPFGIDITTSTDLSHYAKSSIDFGNNTRLVLARAYVNGRPAQTLSNVPLGSLVELQYKRQYFVSISAPGNYTTGWFDEGSTIVVSGPAVIDLGNGIRLAKPTLSGIPLPATYRVTGPADLSVSYVKQYLVTYSGPTWRNQTWIDAGATITLNPPRIIDFGNNTRLINPLIDGAKPPLIIVVDKPLVVSVSYTRQHLVSLTGPINNTAVWINASSTIVLRLPPVVDFGNGTRLIDPLINGTRPPLTVEVDKPMSFVGTYTKQYLVTYAGPTWRNQTWVNAGASTIFNPPQAIDFDNDTRLAYPLVNGTRPPLTVVVDKPLLVTVNYTRQYLVSLTSPINNTAVWINASSIVVLNLPPIVDLDNGARFVEPRINGTRPPLVVEVNRPMSFVGTYVNKQYLVTYSGPTWRDQTWVNAGTPLVFNPPQIIDFGNNTRLAYPLVNGTAPPLTIVVDKPSLVTVNYTRQYLVSLTSPINNTAVWINASSTIVLRPPPIVDFGNNTRLVNPLINGTKPPLSITVDKPISLSVEYTKQYLVSINTPFNKTAVWIDAGASYTPPASATSTNGVTFVPTHLTIDGRRAPLAPVPVDAPLDITVHYNAYAEVSTTFAGLPALYAEASITCGGASNSTSGFFVSSLRLELIDAPAGKCSTPPPKVVPLLVLIVVVVVIAAIVVLFRKLRKR